MKVEGEEGDKYGYQEGVGGGGGKGEVSEEVVNKREIEGGVG